MHWVYILRCSDDSLYIGETNELTKRLASHNAGHSAFTAQRCPVRIVYSEEFENRPLALARERQLKRWTSAKKEALVRGDLQALRRL